jgi:hypothetical protein
VVSPDVSWTLKVSGTSKQVTKLLVRCYSICYTLDLEIAMEVSFMNKSRSCLGVASNRKANPFGSRRLVHTVHVVCCRVVGSAWLVMWVSVSSGGDSSDHRMAVLYFNPEKATASYSSRRSYLGLFEDGSPGRSERRERVSAQRLPPWVR